MTQPPALLNAGAMHTTRCRSPPAVVPPPTSTWFHTRSCMPYENRACGCRGLHTAAHALVLPAVDGAAADWFGTNGYAADIAAATCNNLPCAVLRFSDYSTVHRTTGCGHATSLLFWLDTVPAYPFAGLRAAICAGGRAYRCAQPTVHIFTLYRSRVVTGCRWITAPRPADYTGPAYPLTGFCRRGYYRVPRLRRVRLTLVTTYKQLRTWFMHTATRGCSYRLALVTLTRAFTL